LVQKVCRETLASTWTVPAEDLGREERSGRAGLFFVRTPGQGAGKNPSTAAWRSCRRPGGDDAGKILGVLYGGTLLNRNYQIVTRSATFSRREIQGEALHGTIFQGGLRISTNVSNESGERAVGTGVSEEVYEAVIRKGQSWLARTFVVRDWYITAYEPIRDLNGKIIGMLYVGMLEAPYIDLQNKVVYSFFAIGVLGVVIVLLLSFSSPPESSAPSRNARATRWIAAGDLAVEIPISRKMRSDSWRSLTTTLAGLKQARQELEGYGGPGGEVDSNGS
jgi:two-component system NtrC family sensor kinase